MVEPKDAQAQAAWDITTRVVGVIRWDREEQRAEAFVEILVVVGEELERLATANRRVFLAAAGEPGRN